MDKTFAGLKKLIIAAIEKGVEIFDVTRPTMRDTRLVEDRHRFFSIAEKRKCESPLYLAVAMLAGESP